MSTLRAASCGTAYDTPPQIADGASKTWVTRGANFVVAISDVKAGAKLARTDNPDEYVILLSGTDATIEAGGETITANDQSLTIVPPGASAVTARGDGQIVRVFSNQATDMVDASANATAYAGGAPDVAPLKPWPAPPAGFKLRNYMPYSYDKPDTNMRLFRCSNLMINVLTKREAPRDTSKLSPHSHDDFEQASLLLEGRYVHHMRYPWTTNKADWREDEHLEVGSPSVVVIPSKVVHTSRNVGNERSWLIDIFAPPRVDFSKKPGLVINADEYPMPAAN